MGRNPDITVDGRFTTEGVSVSAYDDSGNVLEETWFTWDEIEELKTVAQSDFTFGFDFPEKIVHSFDVGDSAVDSTEPTPSPEANTVRIVELIDATAEEYVIEETGKTVAEHNPYFPDDDPVVVGVYPNMSSDKRWHFPESRLDPV